MDIAGFGEWKSPITSEWLVKDAVQFREVACEGDQLYWIQLVPSQQGRFQLATLGKDGTVLDPVPEASVRTRVHEYGGGALAMQGGLVYFVNDRDGRIYRLENGRAVPITPPSNLRLADMSISPKDGSVYVVGEEHEQGGSVINKLVRFDAKGAMQVVASGHDFYSSPRVSPDGKELVWITWDHPQMPWDGTNLWRAKIAKDGTLEKPIMVAGSVDESVCSVRWSKKGELYFVSDRTGWWNLYRDQVGKIETLYPLAADFAAPQWAFGNENYGFTPEGNLVCAYTKMGRDHLAFLNPEKKTLEELKLPFTMIRNLVVCSKTAYFFGATPTLPASLVKLDLKNSFLKEGDSSSAKDSGLSESRLDPALKGWDYGEGRFTTQKYEILKESTPQQLGEEWISKPESLAFPTRHKDTSYAFYYPPKNPQFQARKGELPPLIVKCHGGPTGQVFPAFSMETQFWTSRGFAFLDVNYSGSSGYGRAYRKRLEGTWGIRDVDDCMDGALFLVNKKLADAKRLLIRGGSAGGYTTLAALAFHNLFAAGTSYYGVSDLELLEKETHKFEAHYLDRLVAPYPEARQVYLDRSPIQHVDQFSKPLLILQGSIDPVVPPDQAEAIYEALKKKGVPVAMIIFEGEQHGFKIAKNIMRALDAELYFYSKILKLSLPEKIEPVQIDNLPK